MTSAERDSLILEHLNLPSRCVSNMRIGWAFRGSHSREDFVSVATIAMIEATERWDPTREGAAGFHGYAWQRMRGAVLDELRRLDLLSRRERNALEEKGWSTVRRHVPLSQRLVDALPGGPIHGDDCPCCAASGLHDLVYALSKESPRITEFLRLYYMEHQTLKAIGKKYGVTEARVSQLMQRSARTMSRHLHELVYA